MFKFDPIFSNGAILQAQKPVCVCGYGEGEITVSLGDLTQNTVAADGKWSVCFPAQPYCKICDLTASSADESITLTGITFGDVYLLAGQSNMQFKLREAHPDGEIYECDDIRLYSTARLENNEYFLPKDGWVKCNKETAPHFSAIGYFLARDLHKRDGRPIGLVALYQGASVIQSWLSLEALDDLAIETPDGELHWDHHNPDYRAWNEKSTLYSFGLSQATPLSYKAVLWYQGESNTSEQESFFYDKMLAKMIELWRNDLRDPELDFVIIQIADFIPRKNEAWNRVQEAQERVAQQTPNCYLVKCADICENDDIHPKTKHLLVKRILDLI
jgi:sialate O-acetylesterase